MINTSTASQHHSLHASANSQELQCEELRKECEELCFQQHLKPARDKAVLALKLATDTFGKNSLRLIPYYLVLVQISLQEHQLKQAEELLSLVNWLLVKDRKAFAANDGVGAPTVHNIASHDELPEEVKNLYVIRMNKLYSMLLMEYKAHNEALQRAAHGTYHCSLLFGPEHLYTSELYFCLGQIFNYRQQQQQHSQSHSQNQNQAQLDHDNALGMFDKVVDIWYRFLTNPPEETAAWMLQHQRQRIREASGMLQHIVTIRSNALGPKHVATGEVMYTQGLLFLFLGEHTQAKQFVQQALELYIENLGADHPSTLDVKNVLHQLEEAGV